MTGVQTCALPIFTQLRALVPLLHRRVAWLMAVLAVPFLAAVVPLLAVRFAQGGDALRINLWRSAAAIFLRDPLTGSGPGTWVQLKVATSPPGAARDGYRWRSPR